MSGQSGDEESDGTVGGVVRLKLALPSSDFSFLLLQAYRPHFAY